MVLAFTRVYAGVLFTLAIVGLFVKGQLFGVMNSDMGMDIFRLIFAACLVYVSFIAKSNRGSAIGLLALGGLYIVMGVVGIFSATFLGLLPSGFTAFDIAFHLATGITAAFVSILYLERDHAPAHLAASEE